MCVCVCVPLSLTLSLSVSGALHQSECEEECFSEHAESGYPTQRVLHHLLKGTAAHTPSSLTHTWLRPYSSLCSALLPWIHPPNQPSLRDSPLCIQEEGNKEHTLLLPPLTHTHTHSGLLPLVPSSLWFSAPALKECQLGQR